MKHCSMLTIMNRCLLILKVNDYESLSIDSDGQLLLSCYCCYCYITHYYPPLVTTGVQVLFLGASRCGSVSLFPKIVWFTSSKDQNVLQWSFGCSIYIFATWPLLSCSVCVSVTFVNCVRTNKHIIKIFSLSGRSIILVFPCQTA